MSSLVDTISSNFVTIRFSYIGITGDMYDDIISYIDSLRDNIYSCKFDLFFYTFMSDGEASIVFKFPEDAAVFRLKFNIICFIE